METKVFSVKSAILVCLVVGLLVAGLSAFAQTSGWGMQVFGGTSTSTTPTTTQPIATQGSGSSYDIPGRPTRLVIPSIGVDANVQSVGMWWRDPSQIGIPTNFTDVAWYNGGPKPGEPGSAVIDGHLDGKSVKEAVFFNLDKLKPGDLVEVTGSDGKTIQFKVTNTKLYDYNAATNDIFDPDPAHTRLILITCGGDYVGGQYDKRVVVFTELVR